MRRFQCVAVLLAIGLSNLGGRLEAQILGEKNELYQLILIQTDLAEASRQMTIYDPNEDGAIDRSERERLPWREVWKDFDLNSDGKLTHLEIAVRQAKLREKDDVTEFDVKNVQVFLNRYDLNRNGQLDPEEIEQSGWPSDPSEYDANKDGVLTMREMAVQFAFNRGLRRQMGIEAVDNVGATRLINRFDTDNDKKLSAAERADAPLPLSGDSFDDDGDGNLGQMELATLLAKHRQDSGLTKPDTIKIRNLFSMFDPEMTGTIDLSRFESQDSENAIGGAFGGPNVEAVRPYDTNKDGKVTMKEVEKIVAEIRKERGYTEVEFDRAKRMLARHDLNRSKYIEPSELFETETTGRLPKSMIADADRDADGRVSLDELARYFVGKSNK